ncbi:hypothetical protein ACIPY6_40565 [Streptomyces sp. NPDC090054]|uniref:hypothetical protein n=1 Tax=Streptomyces sp. NPDC090054 TaxID=3365933 RepID=UPI0038116783
MTLLEVIAHAPAVVPTATGLRALWRLVRRKLPARPPAPILVPVAVESSPPDSRTAPVCGCPEGSIVRYEAADGGVLTVWTVGPVTAAAGRRREENGPW